MSMIPNFEKFHHAEYQLSSNNVGIKYIYEFNVCTQNIITRFDENNFSIVAKLVIVSTRITVEFLKHM